ncbi:MAG: hypothetical protein IPP29_05085 [Bacteroidetes bacterium]|nr:hypothetical protein [Bacteroidota bacterium]
MQEIKLQGIERVILVQSHNLVVDPNNDLEKFVNANGFEKYDEYQKIQVNVCRCESFELHLLPLLKSGAG